ncbi:MAG: hypothetical protein CMO80_16955 [Verrucomicrobiales bacterium]|nr:hypothetical protein [Verrucomicrobiales bacterium]|tara:strand:- start:1379 stop:2428 length:1050 start_codon:yes stop_codon:yes gene_type:complete
MVAVHRAGTRPGIPVLNPFPASTPIPLIDSADSITIAGHAMATRFEFVLCGGNPHSLRAAGEEAMEEIKRLEAELGFYQAGSEIHRLNNHAADAPVRVSPMLFDLLKRCRELNEQTGGAFDVTVAPLLTCWGLAGGAGCFPSTEEIEEARSRCGWDLVEFDACAMSIAFKKPGVMLDLGSVGKGYALDIAAEWLGESGVESALLHGGTSTSYAIGQPPDADAWKLAIVRPEAGTTLDAAHGSPTDDDLLATVALKDASLSVSAVWGKSFEHEGKIYGHVIDPRIGQPVGGALLSAVVTSEATTSDALATALLALGETGHAKLQDTFCGLKSLVALPDTESGYRIVSNGV